MSSHHLCSLPILHSACSSFPCCPNNLIKHRNMQICVHTHPLPEDISPTWQAGNRTAVSCGLSQCGRPWRRHQAKASMIPAEQPSRHTEKQTSLAVGANQSREQSPGQHHPQVNPQGSPTTRTTCGHICQACDIKAEATPAHALFTLGSGDKEPAVNRTPGAQRPPSIPIL